MASSDDEDDYSDMDISDPDQEENPTNQCSPTELIDLTEDQEHTPHGNTQIPDNEAHPEAPPDPDTIDK